MKRGHGMWCVAVALLLLGLSACGGSDSRDGTNSGGVGGGSGTDGSGLDGDTDGPGGGSSSGGGSGSGGGLVGIGAPVSETLGSDGGAVVARNLTLTVPPGALRQPVALVIAEVAPKPGEVARYRFSPLAQSFGIPARLTFGRELMASLSNFFALPPDSHFFWQVGDEFWLVPSDQAGGVLSAEVSSLGYPAAALKQSPGAILMKAATTGGDVQEAGGDLVVRKLECETHVQALSNRLKNAAAIRDIDLAVGIFNDLEAAKLACQEIKLEIYREASCSGLAAAQANAEGLATVEDFAGFQALTAPLFAAQAYVQSTGAQCNVDSVRILALTREKFEQFLQALQSRFERGGEFLDDAQRDLRPLFDYQDACQKLGLDDVCEPIFSELLPPLLDKLRASAFLECVNGDGISALSQFIGMGAAAGSEDKFLGFGSFSMQQIEADLNYCTDPFISIRVFDDALSVPEELPELSAEIRPREGLGQYSISKSINVPKDGSLTVSGSVPALICPDGSVFSAELVARVGDTVLARLPVSGNRYPLDATPFDLVVPRILTAIGQDPATSSGFTVHINREGGECAEGQAAPFAASFNLFQIVVGLEQAQSASPITAAAGLFTRHGCALDADSGVLCWGSNLAGELGIGVTSREPNPLPVAVAGLGGGVRSISAGGLVFGGSTCAVDSNGGVRCWGSNLFGESGNNSSEGFVPTPVSVSGLSSGVRHVSMGGAYACALTEAGGVKCWGLNSAGQLGKGSIDNTRTREVTFSDGSTATATGDTSAVPVDVVGLSGVTQLAAGALQACVLTNDGKVHCWGANQTTLNVNDILVDSSSARPAPVEIAGLPADVATLAVGGGHACVLTRQGEVLCWGTNDFGQLGDGTTTGRAGAAPVVGLSDRVVAISAGFAGTCALLANQSVECWGGLLKRNQEINTQLVDGYVRISDGLPGAQVSPLKVNGFMPGLKFISVGAGQVCAATEDRQVQCFGTNLLGELGNGTTTDSFVPVNVVGLP